MARGMTLLHDVGWRIRDNDLPGAVALLPGCEREGCGDKATRIHEGQVFCATHAPPGALRIVGADQILLLADIIRQNA